jgi:hypothetical protein
MLHRAHAASRSCRIALMPPANEAIVTGEMGGR